MGGKLNKVKGECGPWLCMLTHSGLWLPELGKRGPAMLCCVVEVLYTDKHMGAALFCVVSYTMSTKLGKADKRYNECQLPEDKSRFKRGKILQICNYW